MVTNTQQRQEKGGVRGVSHDGYMYSCAYIQQFICSNHAKHGHPIRGAISPTFVGFSTLRQKKEFLLIVREVDQIHFL